jgi:primosomal protein N' (replication factor Y)
VLVEVAVAQAVRGTFTYRVPARLAPEVSLGRRVAVPFGRSRRATGYVVGFPTEPPAGVELRDVADVLDAFPLFTPELVKLLRWAEDYYLCPPGELHRAALPPGLNARRGAAAPARRGGVWAAPPHAGRGGGGVQRRTKCGSPLTRSSRASPARTTLSRKGRGQDCVSRTDDFHLRKAQRLPPPA